MTKIALTCGLCLGMFACAAPTRPAASVASVDGAAHVTVRAEAGHLWWSHRPWGQPHRLWNLPNHGAVEDLHVDAVAGDSRAPVFVVGFQQGGVHYSGRFGLGATSAHYVEDRDVAKAGLEDTLARSGR